MSSNPKFFRNNAILILGIVFFLIPFALRGAKMSFRSMKNDVKDWLPASFAETKELEWFGRHFFNERFVVLTWEGCSEDDERYHLITKKIRAEVKPSGDELPPLDGPPAEDPVEYELRNAIKNRVFGDRYGLFYDETFPENWGNRDERWLLGNEEIWYFVVPDGTLFRWDNGNNVIAAGTRSFKSARGTYKVKGVKVADLGGINKDNVSRYYENPWLITARRFSGLSTGPEVLETLAAPGGPLWPQKDLSDEDKQRRARAAGIERLTGTLFGPAWHEGYDWTAPQLSQYIPERTAKQLPDGWQALVRDFLQTAVEEQFEGDLEKLRSASFVDRHVLWEELFLYLGVKAPAQQTAMLVYLSEVGKQDLAKVVGRPLMGKPAGRLLALAEASGISTDDDGELRLGGPPVDNVAIDEEGTITLVRLVGYSAVVGLTLSLICFRSINVTLMVFLVGGVSAVTSLSIVYWAGWSVDAILMSMPSLVYVLGLSGAVHIVNYYRDACHEHGLEGAPDRALANGWGPCSLAAFTTALGLLSLYTSNIVPIKKFGLFSAIGVVATLALLFTYLPAALEVWPAGYHRRRRNASQDTLFNLIESFWLGVSRIVIRNYRLVITTSLLMMIVAAYGITKTKPSVQLLKLFDGNSKIIRDYRWLEANLGELVPMEVIVRIAPDLIMPPASEKTFDKVTGNHKPQSDDLFRLNVLERVQIAGRIQRAIERQFGDEGQKVLGRGLSAATFAPDPPEIGSTSGISVASLTSHGMSRLMEPHYNELVREGYVCIDTDKDHLGSELWRISLRLGALNDVDYGLFVHDLRDVVEPIVTAYRHRDEILRGVVQYRQENDLGDTYLPAKIAILGMSNPLAEPSEDDDAQPADGDADGVAVDGSIQGNAVVSQDALYSETLAELLVLAGLDAQWVGDALPKDSLEYGLDEVFDCVVLVNNEPVNGQPKYDFATLEKHGKVFVDGRDFHYVYGDEKCKTAAQRDAVVQVVYTGVVPVVYKAQRTLLESLIQSIGWAFLMIAVVMMIVLRNSPGSLGFLNVRGGLLSMVPNVFPVVVIFGFMGFLGVSVDIGTMMTASVAMGVAVDDTIHFLSWYRKGIISGMSRQLAIELAYSKVGTAMTYTTLIGGMGLAVFMLSTFTPTQRFGGMMLTLLLAALVGDLVLLPAILASPLGKYLSPPHDELVTASPLDSPTVSETGASSPPGSSVTGSSAAGDDDRPVSPESSDTGLGSAPNTSGRTAETPHSRPANRRVDPPHRRRNR
jgi:predicted RND superfamily exporter protein